MVVDDDVGGAVAVRALAVCALAGCGAEVCGASEGEVARVIDGDTVVLSDGRTVRYLLVDAPEADACFGATATRANSALVLGQRVALAYDEVCADRYGRTLAYVQVGAVDASRWLIERGYGCVLYIPPDGSERVDELRAVEAEARAAGRGAWSACAMACK